MHSVWKWPKSLIKIKTLKPKYSQNNFVSTKILIQKWEMHLAPKFKYVYTRNPSPSATTREASGGKLASLAGTVTKWDFLSHFQPLWDEKTRKSQ